MFLTARLLRPRCTAAVILVALSLTGISACSISVGEGSTGRGTTVATSQEGSSPEQPVASSPSTTATTASQAPRSQAAAPSTQEQISPATVGVNAPEVDTQPASDECPGAQATTTDSDWPSDLEFVEQIVSTSPTMLLNESGDGARIEGEMDSLSIAASNTGVFADYVGLLTISGSNVTVYVEDVDRVVTKGTNTEVVWAGNSPKVEDFGHSTGTRQQGSED